MIWTTFFTSSLKFILHDWDDLDHISVPTLRRVFRVNPSFFVWSIALPCVTWCSPRCGGQKSPRKSSFLLGKFFTERLILRIGRWGKIANLMGSWCCIICKRATKNLDHTLWSYDFDYTKWLAYLIFGFDLARHGY